MAQSPAPFDPLRLATSLTWLWAESCFVIAARNWMILTGQPGAAGEAQRMVEEKVRISAELALGAMAGRDLQAGIDHVSRKVSANRRRLARPRKAA